MKLLVCEQWELEVPEPRKGIPRKDMWYADWLTDIKKTSGRVASSYHAIGSLQDIEFNSALEYYGGAGFQTLIIERLLAPMFHNVYDASPLASAHLASNFPELVVGCVRDVDVIDGAQLVMLDYGDFTAHQMLDRLPFLDRVFGARPRAVVLTDVAGHYLHLHRERYSKILGVVVSTIEQYLVALTGYIYLRWGYALRVGYYLPWTAKLVLVPAGQASDGLHPVPARPVGLQRVG